MSGPMEASELFAPSLFMFAVVCAWRCCPFNTASATLHGGNQATPLRSLAGVRHHEPPFEVVSDWMSATLSTSIERTNRNVRLVVPSVAGWIPSGRPSAFAAQYPNRDSFRTPRSHGLPDREFVYPSSHTAIWGGFTATTTPRHLRCRLRGAARSERVAPQLEDG